MASATSSGARRAVGALLTAGLGLAVAGCGSERPGASESEFLHGAGGVDARVGEVLLRDVSIEEPRDTLYRAGDVVRLRVTLFNEAETPDALVDVSSPAAGAVRLTVDRDCDGTPEVVGRVPLQAGAAVRTPAPTTPDGPEVDYRVDLRLDQLLHSGQTVPVTFAFQRAGSTTVQVPVELTDEPLQQDVTRCEPTA